MRTSYYAVILIALLWMGNARANEDDAKTLYERGKIAFALGRFGDAADLFEKAFEKKPDPAMLYNAAQARRLAGDKKKALVLYQNYARMYGEPDNRDEVDRRIAELKSAIAADEAAARASAPPPATNANATPAAPPPAAAPSTPAATTLTQAAPPRHESVAHKGWFWGVVVGGVLVAGGAVALGIVFGSTHKDPSITLGTVTAN
jgi:tetratricopeptide (TPR) repeat protein